MGTYLDRAKAHFGQDTNGMLDGGRYALLHTRSLEFDDLRPYVPGDDVRDIDWKATARSGQVLIKRFVTEKHHKILVVADAGRNITAAAPSGERNGTWPPTSSARWDSSHCGGPMRSAWYSVTPAVVSTSGCGAARRTSNTSCTDSITTPPQRPAPSRLSDST